MAVLDALRGLGFFVFFFVAIVVAPYSIEAYARRLYSVKRCGDNRSLKTSAFNVKVVR
jgi:hypothetical protein